MSTVSKNYEIDRKAASRLLKVTTRTVDRYVRQGKLTSQTVGGRVWLDKDEIGALKELRRPQAEVVDVDMSRPRLSIDKDIDIDVDAHPRMSTSATSRMYMRSEEGGIYKGLYEKLVSENNEKEERLSRVTYKLGELEARLKYSVPLIQYEKEKKLLTTSNKKLGIELDKAVLAVRQARRDYSIERFNKHIYLIILIGLLVLQPIFWLLLR